MEKEVKKEKVTTAPVEKKTEEVVKAPTPLDLHLKLADIQLKLKAPKSQFNSFAKFNYRNCEDILEAVKPLLNGLVLTICDEIVIVGERYYVKATAKLTDGTFDVDCIAYAREAEQKTGMDSAQVTGATSSYARKYALNGLFLIDDTKDADSDDNSPKTAPVKPVNRVVPTTTRTQTTPTAPTTPVTPKVTTVDVTPTTPVAPTAPAVRPASMSQLTWVAKILTGRKEKDQITDAQLKGLDSQTASAFISGKVTSEQLFKVLGIAYKKEVAPKKEGELDFTAESLMRDNY